MGAQYSRRKKVQSAGAHWLSVGKRRHLQKRYSRFPSTAGITVQLLREECRVGPAWSASRCCAWWSLWLAGPGAQSLLVVVPVCLRCFVRDVWSGSEHPTFRGTGPRTDFFLVKYPVQRRSPTVAWLRRCSGTSVRSAMRRRGAPPASCCGSSLFSPFWRVSCVSHDVGAGSR